MGKNVFKLERYTDRELLKRFVIGFIIAGVLGCFLFFFPFFVCFILFFLGVGVWRGNLFVAITAFMSFLNFIMVILIQYMVGLIPYVAVLLGVVSALFLIWLLWGRKLILLKTNVHHFWLVSFLPLGLLLIWFSYYIDSWISHCAAFLGFYLVGFSLTAFLSDFPHFSGIKKILRR